MRDGGTGERNDDQNLRAAQEEQDPARIAAASEAEAERKRALSAAITQAAHRDAAELVARNDAYIRVEREKAERNLQMRLEAGAEEENSLLRRRLVAERKAASSATFSLVIVSILLVVGVVAGGAYYVSSQNNAVAGASAGVTPGAVASATSLTKSSDVASPESTPTTIHVNPLPAGSPSPAQNLQGSTPPVRNAGIRTNEAIGPLHGETPPAVGNLSGAALGNDDNRAGGESGLGSGVTTSLPSGDSGTEPRSSSP